MASRHSLSVQHRTPRTTRPASSFMSGDSRVSRITPSTRPRSGTDLREVVPILRALFVTLSASCSTRSRCSSTHRRDQCLTSMTRTPGGPMAIRSISSAWNWCVTDQVRLVSSIQWSSPAPSDDSMRLRRCSNAVRSLSLANGPQWNGVTFMLPFPTRWVAAKHTTSSLPPAGGAPLQWARRSGCRESVGAGRATRSARILRRGRPGGTVRAI